MSRPKTLLATLASLAFVLGVAVLLAWLLGGRII